MPPRNRQRPAASSSLKANPEPLMTSTPPGSAPASKTTAPPDEELVYLSARVPKSLRTELQLYAVREGVPVVKLVQDAVRAYLDAHSNT